MFSNIIPISAFKDNYIWLYHNYVNKTCFVVDPGDAIPVLKVLDHLELSLEAILITHHHSDHVGGVIELTKVTKALVYGPTHSPFPKIDIPLIEGDRFELKSTGVEFQVLEIPGHTLDHIAYYNDEILFCGDTLFSAGCGRLFEGTAEQMYTSLTKLANLPESTLVYCAHEYTEANLKFALSLEPNNPELIAYTQKVNALRAQQKPSLPSFIAQEKLINPFLRCNSIQPIEKYNKKHKVTDKKPSEIFAELRKLKDNF